MNYRWSEAGKNSNGWQVAHSRTQQACDGGSSSSTFADQLRATHEHDASYF